MWCVVSGLMVTPSHTLAPSLTCARARTDIPTDARTHHEPQGDPALKPASPVPVKVTHDYCRQLIVWNVVQVGGSGDGESGEGGEVGGGEVGGGVGVSGLLSLPRQSVASATGTCRGRRRRRRVDDRRRVLLLVVVVVSSVEGVVGGGWRGGKEQTAGAGNEWAGGRRTKPTAAHTPLFPTCVFFFSGRGGAGALGRRCPAASSASSALRTIPRAGDGGVS